MDPNIRYQCILKFVMRMWGTWYEKSFVLPAVENNVSTEDMNHHNGDNTYHDILVNGKHHASHSDKKTRQHRREYLMGNK